MAQPLNYDTWVQQKYTQTDAIKDLYAMGKIIETVDNGNTITTADVQSWRANIPSSFDTRFKQKGYSEYLANFQ